MRTKTLLYMEWDYIERVCFGHFIFRTNKYVLLSPPPLHQHTELFRVYNFWQLFFAFAFDVENKFINTLLENIIAKQWLESSEVEFFDHIKELIIESGKVTNII